MSERKRFVVRFPCVTLPDHLGNHRALVFMSAKPNGADANLVLATCMDIEGRLHPNVPMSMAAIKYASERGAVTLVEAVDGGTFRTDLPMGGLVGLDGKKLGG